ncbi:cofactor assembly of complex C subunit B [Euhalothece natronophila Z-M001]|uniref:Cofactor assembly of complex C subunit B n=1 Tax=Euhalothece natronophila Z-M001 TaxID=522448 RepID=A0A5B8NJ54_9CHRO|nr:cofactor assembly of complex C subunit B [Euhalothece natronophila]QDZ38511.1 cofactor assembly of complex C subunit B [Euhalothece natronophila Z-M001]
MTTTPILSSTFLLTCLLLVGLIFFIRASVKDRTREVQFTANIPESKLIPEIKNYFFQRAYKVKSLDPNQEQVILEGFVQPSWFLAIFLSVLAALGLLCISLVLFLFFSEFNYRSFFFILLAFSPLAGIFYWKKAGRVEEVSLKLETSPNSSEENSTKSLITVKAHRDELIALQQALSLTMV